MSNSATQERFKFKVLLRFAILLKLEALDFSSLGHGHYRFQQQYYAEENIKLMINMII